MRSISDVVDVQGSTEIIPDDGAFQFRGTSAFEPITASQRSLANTYCKDIDGCGNADYRSVGIAGTFNYVDGCKPRLNGVISLSGLFKNSASTGNIDDMLTFLRLNWSGDGETMFGFDASAANSCGII